MTKIFTSFLTKIFSQFLTKIFAQFFTKMFVQFCTIFDKIFAQFLTKIFRQITQMSKGAIIITTVSDRVDSRVLPKWAELKMVYIILCLSEQQFWKFGLLYKCHPYKNKFEEIFIIYPEIFVICTWCHSLLSNCCDGLLALNLTGLLPRFRWTYK